MIGDSLESILRNCRKKYGVEKKVSPFWAKIGETENHYFGH